MIATPVHDDARHFMRVNIGSQISSLIKWQQIYMNIHKHYGLATHIELTSYVLNIKLPCT